MGYSTTTRTNVLNWLWRGVAFTPPATIYLALLTANPSSDAGSGLVEMTTSLWTGYARTSIAATVWSAPTGTAPQSISNSAAVTPAGTAASAVTISGVAYYDAASAGNFLGWAAVGSGAVASGNGISFAVNALTIQE